MNTEPTHMNQTPPQEQNFNNYYQEWGYIIYHMLYNVSMKYLSTHAKPTPSIGGNLMNRLWGEMGGENNLNNQTWNNSPSGSQNMLSPESMNTSDGGASVPYEWTNQTDNSPSSSLSDINQNGSVEAFNDNFNQGDFHQYVKNTVGWAQARVRKKYSFS